MDIRYLFYNLLRSDYKKIRNYAVRLKEEYGIPERFTYFDMLRCLFKYDTRFLDYFYFRFFDPVSRLDWEKHTNVWDMYLFQKKYNDAGERHIFRDKIAFREKFKDYFSYPFVVLKSEESIPGVISFLRENGLKKIVMKNPLGSEGKGVKVIEIKGNGQYLAYEWGGGVIDDEAGKVLYKLYKDGYTLCESFVEQHEALSRLNPDSVNTVRIVTFVNDFGKVEMWGTLLRIGLRGTVDNFDAGGLSAKIDEESGKVVSPAKSKNPFDMNEYTEHPVSHSAIMGLQIPYWGEVLSMVQCAALEVKGVRTVGWDIAITRTGPTFIEGNDNWDKTLFELITGNYLGEKVKSLLRN